MRKRQGIWINNDIYDLLRARRFTYEQAGRLLYAMIHYSFSREYNYEYDGIEMKLPDGGFDKKVYEVFMFFKELFDEDFKKVEAKSELMRRNGRKGGIAKAKKMKEKEARKDEQ